MRLPRRNDDDTGRKAVVRRTEAPEALNAASRDADGVGLVDMAFVDVLVERRLQ